MTPQEIFDKALKGVVAQGGRSTKPDERNTKCAYRGEGGRACGVGHLIDDETAKIWDSLESGTAIDAVHGAGLLPDNLAPHIDLLAAIQGAHDTAAEGGRDHEIQSFIESMKGVAVEHDLVFTDPRTETV